MASSSRILLVGLGAMLLAGELVVGVRALWFTQQTPMYRAFYIARSRDCWLPAAVEAMELKKLARPEIDPAALDWNGACFVLGQGWNRYPPWGDTTQARRAWLELPPPPGATALDITLANISPASPQIVWVRLDDAGATRLTLPPGQIPVELRLALPAGDAATARLAFDRPHEPDGNPMRVLRLKWMEN